MTALDRLNFIIATYVRLIAGLFNFRLWPPFLIYFILLAVIILMIAGQFAPGMSWMIALNTWVAGAGVLHYPQHYSYLPYSFERMSIVPSLLLESLLTAAAIVMFAAYFRRERVKFFGALREVMPSYFKILVIWVVNFLLVYLLFKALPGLFSDFIEGAPRRQLALYIGLRGLAVLLTSLFIYALPFLLLKRRPLLASFTGSFSLFFRSFFTTIVFVGLPQFLVLPLVYALQNTGNIVDKFNPDVVVWLTGALALAMNLANFFTTGAIVRFFLEIADD